MEIELNLSKLKKNDLTPNEYCILYCIANNKDITWLNPELQEDNELLKKILLKLESKLWIKIVNNQVYLREKSQQTDLLGEKDPTFEEFWDSYKLITGLPKTDAASAKKYWNKLSGKKKKLALNNIEPFFLSLNQPKGSKYIKKARTYLSDENFMDEFNVKNKIISSTEMI